MSAGSSARGGASAVLAIAAAAGACTMTIELAAVRLLAPWFGTSVGVWTNVIGVILLALALGYLLGARWSAGPAPERTMAWVLLGAAAWTAWLPALAPWVCRELLPDGLALDQSAELWQWGSLAATLLLFLPAALLLGCVGPLAVECVQRRDGGAAGSAGGRVLGLSTVGSLAGTFATTHWLVPEIGLTGTFLAAAATLFVLGATLATLQRGTVAATAILAAAIPMGLAAAFSRFERGPLLEGVTLRAQLESPYQSLRVVEHRSSGRLERLLQINEGLDSFQSVWIERTGLLGVGFYYDLFALPAWWSDARSSWKVLVLGLGAGTAFRVLEGASPPGCRLDLAGVEIDPAIVDLGRAWFDLGVNGDRRRIVAGVDGRAALRRLEHDFDLVVLDAYAHQTEIPFHMASEEALREIRAHLAPHGWIAINVGGFDFDDPVVAAIGTTLARVFPEGVLGYRVPRSRNFVLFARRDAAVPTPDDPSFRLAEPLAPELLAGLGLPSAWRRFEPASDDARLSDDRSPLDRLQRRSLEQARARLAGAL